MRWSWFCRLSQRQKTSEPAPDRQRLSTTKTPQTPITRPPSPSSEKPAASRPSSTKKAPHVHPALVALAIQACSNLFQRIFYLHELPEFISSACRVQSFGDLKPPKVRGCILSFDFERLAHLRNRLRFRLPYRFLSKKEKIPSVFSLLKGQAHRSTLVCRDGSIEGLVRHPSDASAPPLSLTFPLPLN